MQWHLEKLIDFCNFIGLPHQYAQFIIPIALVALFICFVVVAQRVLRVFFTAIAHFWAKRSRNVWDDTLCKAHFPGRLSHLVVAIISSRFVEFVFADTPRISEIFIAGTRIYFALAIAGTIYALINTVMHASMENERLRDVPIKGFFQALKVILALTISIWILSILSDKSPAYFLSGIGALMAILLIVFKDALLGFTAGILISTNDIVRNKDWIEIRGTDVDGEVFDVSLTTVKVRNWDNTISNVPAYTLISSAFKNWRGMEKSGGRRIKRAINIDMQTIHFASEKEIEHWKKIELLKPYFETKLEEIQRANANIPIEKTSSPANIRLLTNIGTFRAYCMAYLKANTGIHQGMTMLVRQLNPGANGLPIEIYVFTNDTRWAKYENIQSDIFDHLLAIIPEFGLTPFQDPSGRNFEMILKK